MIEKAVLLNGNPPSEALCAIWHIRCPNHPVATNQIHNIKNRIFYRSRSVKKWLRPPFEWEERGAIFVSAWLRCPRMGDL